MSRERSDVRSGQVVQLAEARSPPPDIAAGSGGHSLSLVAVTHRFGGFTAVDGVSLEIEPGELVALLGPSGCGKTTLLRIIAGFLVPSEGDVVVDNQSVKDIPPHKRGIGIVFQNYALFPHMSVERNLAYGLEARHAPRALVRETVDRVLALVKLEPLRRRYPRELSGGQQQRVALARVLAVQPRILLLDEPFSALDKGLRLDMQIEIKKLQREFNITTILVTHDQEEAMSMADRIAVLNDGVVQQFATPTEIYDRPAREFVSRFVGTNNFLHGRLVSQDGSRGEIELDCGAIVPLAISGDIAPGQRVVVAIRPERLAFSAVQSRRTLNGTVAMALPLGPSTIYQVELPDGTSLKVVVPRAHEASSRPERHPAFLEITSETACAVFPEANPNRKGGTDA